MLTFFFGFHRPDQNFSLENPKQKSGLDFSVRITASSEILPLAQTKSRLKIMLGFSREEVLFACMCLGWEKGTKSQYLDLGKNPDEFVRRMT